MGKTKWIISIDDFDDGNGEQEYPHCPNCGRGVYKRDAGNYCPFCGTYMGLNKKLTDRQIELIEDLLNVYKFHYMNSRIIKASEGYIFQFNGEGYVIWKQDYKQVCEIIDYIKGVKKEC